MDFDLTDIQLSWRSKAEALGKTLASDVSAGEVVREGKRVGLLDPKGDLLAAVVAVEALASDSAAAAIAFGLHMSVVLGGLVDANDRGDGQDAAAGKSMLVALLSGDKVGAVALSSEDVPDARDGRLSGRASWVAPLTGTGIAIVGARRPSDGVGATPAAGRERADAGSHFACLVALDAAGVTVERVRSAGLQGLVCGHVRFAAVPFRDLGDTQPIMSRVRILLAAAGLGMGRRALREALEAARAYIRTGAGGEQTVQGLLADAATELDAARLLTWKAASGDWLSLAEASAAKLIATEATQRAVARATQVVGGESFRHGHVIERLAQDVRALELFAGRTEALREAVADEVLPRS